MIFQQWHLWQGTKGYLLSDENTKQLESFPDADAAINWLYLNGHKEAARHFNKAMKEI